MHKLLRCILSDLFNHVYSETHDANTRKAISNDLAIPRARTNYYSRSFAVQGAKVWNGLSSSIRSSENINIFKRRYKNQAEAIT